MARPVVLLLALAACGAPLRTARFTPERVERIERGMSPEEVEGLFGPPTQAETFTYGRGTGHETIVTRWVYRVGRGPNDFNTFDFHYTYGEPLLGRWTLYRTAEDR